MSDQDVEHPSVPLVWHERMRRGLKQQKGTLPEGLFVSEVQRIGELQWRAISFFEGSYFGSPPGLYIETNMTQEGLDVNPDLIVHHMTSAITVLLMNATKDTQSIPIPDHLKKLYPTLNDHSRISLGNGVTFQPYKTTDRGNVILKVIAPSLVESMNAVRSLEPKQPKKFSLKDLFKR